MIRVIFEINDSGSIGFTASEGDTREANATKPNTLEGI